MGEKLYVDTEKYAKMTVHNDGSIELYVPRSPYFAHNQPVDTSPTDKSNWSQEEIEIRENENIDRSTRRARKAIRNHVKNNDHTHFVTLTYDLNEYPTNEMRFSRMKNFLSDMKRKYGAFDYCLVPEHHNKGKSKGLVHWHGVMNLTNFELVRATDPKNKRELFDRFGNEVYNLSDWLTTGAITHVTELRDKNKASGYLTKYIAKDMTKVVGKGKKKYWSSRGAKPVEKLISFDETVKFILDEEPAFSNERGSFYDINYSINER